MKKTFCTISTHSHLFKSFALADSLAPYGGILHILLVDSSLSKKEAPPNVQFHFLKDLQSNISKKIQLKYSNKQDCLRWSLKSVFLIHLLQTDKTVIYIDNDIYFYSDPSFLFEKLSASNILLSPHHYPRDPEKNQNWFEANFKVGLYNAGFLGANNQSIDVLIWWAKACLYRCEKNAWRGLFDDQKYLDLFPIIEKKTKIIEHLGCNVAEWNAEVCVKKESSKGLVINEEFPLVFYHFNYFSLQNLSESSYLLTSYLTALQKYKPSINFSSLVPKESNLDKIKLFLWKILNQRNG